MMNIVPKDKKLEIGKIFLYRVGILNSVFVFFVATLFLFLSFLVYVFLNTSISYKSSRLEELNKQIQSLQDIADKKKNNEFMLVMDSAIQSDVPGFSQAIQFIIDTFAKTENVYLDSLNIKYKHQNGTQNDTDSAQTILSINIDARADSKADIIKLVKILKKQAQVTGLDDNLLLSSMRKTDNEGVVFKLKFNYKI